MHVCRGRAGVFIGAMPTRGKKGTPKVKVRRTAKVRASRKTGDVVSASLLTGAVYMTRRLASCQSARKATLARFASLRSPVAAGSSLVSFDNHPYRRVDSCHVLRRLAWRAGGPRGAARYW